MNTNTKRGFTLMELLVVIAIIGILASVVLASLNSARSKGADAAIKSNLNNARAQAELFYDNNANTYDPAGASNSVCEVPGGILNMVTAADTANGTGNAGCSTNGSAWAAAAELVSDATLMYCVDSTGAAEVSTGDVGAGEEFVAGTTMVCP